MNDLIVRKDNLPAMPTEDVKQCVDIIGDAINALKAKRSQATRINCNQAVIDEMNRQIREYSAFRLQAQIELGKRSAEMETNKDFHGNQFGEIRSTENTKTKADQLAELGIRPQRAHEMETMAANEKVVNQYIDEQLSTGKAPSQHGALKAIKEQESYIKEKEEEGDVEIAANLSDEKRAAILKELNNTDKSHKKIAKEYGVDRRTVDRISNKMKLEDGFVDGAELSTKALNKRIDEDYQKMVNQEKHEYTIEDAEDEFGIIMDEFISKLRRVIQVRKEVIKGNKLLKQLIISFSIELRKLKEEI